MTSLECKNIAVEDLYDIKKFTSFHNFKKNQIIFYEGHNPYGLFILISGEIEIKCTKKPMINNYSKKISDPSILGISAFKNNLPFSGTLKTSTDCHLYFLSMSSYQNLKEDKHPLYYKLKKY